MRISWMLGAAVSVFAMAHGNLAYAQDAQQGAEETTGFGDIIVTARREAESLQTVPVAVSVLNDQQFAAAGGTFRPENITASVPSLNTTSGGDSDRGNVIFTIRGQGSTYGALFPSVITYFADVPTQYLPAGSFFDTDGLQVLRGPQGVQFGRVTNGGNIMIGPRKPTDELSADISLKGGTYNLIGTTGFANVPLGETLAMRFAWDVTKRDGFTKNIADGKDRDDVNYQSARFGIVWKPTDTFENYLVGQYQQTDDNGTGLIFDTFNPASIARSVAGLFGPGGPLVTGSDFGLNAPIYGINPTTGMVGAFGENGQTTPLNSANYIAQLQKYVDEQRILGKRKVNSLRDSYNRRKYVYIVNTTTADISDNVTIKNIFGYTRYIERSAQNYSGDNSGYVTPCHDSCPFAVPPNNIPFIDQEQLSEELRISGKFMDNRLTWSLGGYMDEQKPGGPRENDTISNGILEYLVEQQAVTKSRAVYGYAEFGITDAFKINGGVRYTHDTVSSDNVNYIALLPAPGLQNGLFNALKVYRDIFGVPAYQGLDDATLQGIATATANSAGNVEHGTCQDYNFGFFAGECINTKGSFNSLTWTFGASYQFSPRMLAYVKYSKGYRPGGVNATAPTGFENLRSFNPENNFSFEAGIKSDWQLGTVPLRTNLTFYKDRYKKIQQAISILDPVSGTPGSIVTNVAAAGLWGLEFEGSIRPFEGFTIGANYSYTHARFNRGGLDLADLNKGPTNPLTDPVTGASATYLACNNTATINVGFCTFNRFSNTPKHQLGVNAQLDFIRDEGGIGTMGIGGNWYYQSSSAQNNTTNSFLSPIGIQKPYSTLNLTANWTGMLGSKLDLTLFLTNVTNETHWTSVQSNLHVSSIGNQSIIYSPPRMFGGSLTAHF